MTELRNGTAAPRESEARYRTLAEVNPDGIVVMDEASVIVSANPAMERIFGYPPEELIGRSLYLLIPERFHEAHRIGVERYLETGRRNIPWTGVELPGLTRSGREISVEIAFGEYVHDGRPRFAGFIHDISLRKRDEARRSAEHAVTRALADSRALRDAAPRILRAIGESLGWDLGTFWQVDHEADVLRCVELWHRDGVIVEQFEEATRELLLVPSEGLPGRVWASGRAAWIRDVEADGNFPRAQIAAAEGLHAGFGFPVTVGDQISGVIEFFTHEVEEPDESLLRTVEAIGSEIGQFVERKRAEGARDRALLEADEARRRAEKQAVELELQTEELQAQAAQLEETQADLEISYEELQQANRELEARTEEAERARRLADEASQAKSAFLANMSHELRTPINAIIGYDDLLEMGLAGPLNDEQKAYAQRIKRSSEHLLGLITDVLDLAKVESGQIQVRRERVLLRDSIEGALDLVSPQAAERGVQLSNEAAAAGDITCWGDGDRVRQILVNLLSNAVKFTGSGGEIRIAGAVTERADPDALLLGDGPWVRTDVEDTGIGIPAERLQQIFDPFYQVDGGYTRESGGTGLGLSIARQLARLMSGDLTVRSRPGEGSCFTLWLPWAWERNGEVESP